MPTEAHEIEGLRELLQRIYAPQTHEAFVGTLLRAVTELIPCHGAGYHLLPANGPSQLWTHPTPMPPERVLQWADHLRNHPLMAIHRATGESRAFAYSTIMSQEELHKLPGYQTLYQPLGFEDGLAFFAAAGDGITLAFGLFRATWGFSEREIQLVNLLPSHLVQARQNALMVERLQSEGLVSCEEMRALVRLAPDGRLHAASPRALEMLSAYCEVVEGGPAPPAIRTWLDSAGTAPLLLERGPARLYISRLRLAPGWPGCFLVLDERTPVSWIERTAVDAMGLTPREAEVLRWIAEGKTNSDMAVILDISVRTVDKHVERIREKLRVETRTAAVARVHELIREGDHRGFTPGKRTPSA